MADVFVSYARDDRVRVEQLAKALEARGFNVWWDPELLPGEQYAQKLSQVLGDCKAVLVVWSNASTARPWVLDEASVGRDRGVLVPVLIEKVDAPLGFRQMQAEDLTTWPGPSGEENFERVVRALEGLRGAAAAPKPPSPFPAQPTKTAGEGFGFMRGDAAAAPAPKAKSNRWLVIGGGGALALLALVAIGQIAGGGGGAGGGSTPPPAPQVGELGADKGYGLTKKEFATLDMQKLVQTALQRTTLEKIEEGAKAGDAAGQLLLCGVYDWGAGSIQADPDAARSWCEQAADQGQPYAIHYVGMMHLEGVAGYQKDRDVSHKMIEKAAAAGDARAETYLGGLYLDGSEGYPNDDLKALSFYRSAAEQGYQDAQFSVAWIYENGRGVPKDYPTALVWYQKLADEGSPIGTRGVGWMYYKGWAIDQDFQKAREYFVKASELGDGQASFNLGTMYENGEGVPKDLDQALKYYHVASEQKFADADTALKRLGKGQ